MNAQLQPWQLLLLTLAGWINRRQQDAVEYLLSENRVREKLGKKRVQNQLPGRLMIDVSHVGNGGTKLQVSRQFDAIPERYLSRQPVRDRATIEHLSAQVLNPF